MGSVYESVYELLYLFKWIGYSLGGEKSNESIAIVWPYYRCIALFGEWFGLWGGEIKIEITILICIVIIWIEGDDLSSEEKNSK